MVIVHSYVTVYQRVLEMNGISLYHTKIESSEDFANKKPGGSWYLFPSLMMNPMGSEAKRILDFTPEVPMSIETWHLFFVVDE